VSESTETARVTVLDRLRLERDNIRRLCTVERGKKYQRWEFDTLREALSYLERVEEMARTASLESLQMVEATARVYHKMQEVLGWRNRPQAEGAVRAQARLKGGFGKADKEQHERIRKATFALVKLNPDLCDSDVARKIPRWLRANAQKPLTLKFRTIRSLVADFRTYEC
jgi:hypothetical protein